VLRAHNSEMICAPYCYLMLSAQCVSTNACFSILGGECNNRAKNVRCHRAEYSSLGVQARAICASMHDTIGKQNCFVNKSKRTLSTHMDTVKHF